MSNHDYVPTPLFYRFKDIMKRGPFHIVFCLAGAKGVGKTSLLKALFKLAEREGKSTRFAERADYISETEYYELATKMARNEEFFLFIDNIHMLPPSENAKRDLKFLLKEKKVYKNWFTITATSRLGLVTLTEELISKDEFLSGLVIVNPVKDIAVQLVEHLQPGTAERYQELLEYLGYVPGSVIECVIKSSWLTRMPDLRSLALPTITKLMVILKQDQQHFLKKDPGLFIKILALLSTNKEVELLDQRLSPGDLPWTLLKASDEHELGGYVVRAVSPAAADVAKSFIFEDRQGLKVYVKALHRMFSGEVGPLSGCILENVICRALMEATILEYFYYSEGSVQRGTLDISALKLSLNEVDSAVIPAELRQGTLVHARHAKDFDLAITDAHGDFHAIQVTKQKWSVKCEKSKFYDETRYTAKYIVTTQVASEESVRAAVARSEKLKTAMERHGLRVLNAHSFADPELLDEIGHLK